MLQSPALTGLTQDRVERAESWEAGSAKPACLAGDARDADGVVMDPREFRNAVGAFATGVVVVTARDQSGTPVGVTANSFTSVSLDPPLVLWCLAKNAQSCLAFEQAEHFAVHILSAEQEDISTRFATRGENKFAGVGVDAGHGDTPLLGGSCTRMQCKTSAIHDGGDHIIIVGEVIAIDTNDIAPLVFHRGRYSFAVTKDDPGPQMPPLRPGEAQDLLGYLLWRAYHQYHSKRWLFRETADVADRGFAVLYALTASDGMSEAELCEMLLMGDRPGDMRDLLRELVDSGLVAEAEGSAAASNFTATSSGRKAATSFVEHAISCDSDIAQRFGPAELDILKNLLQRFIVEITPEEEVAEETKDMSC